MSILHTKTQFNRSSLIGLILFICTLPSLSFAIPFVDFGFKGGIGKALVTGKDSKVFDEYSSSLFAAGAAARFDLAIVQFEANVMYQNLNFTDTQNKTDDIFDLNALNLSLLGRIDISPLPLIKLTVGSGFEQRHILDISRSKDKVSKNQYEDTVYFLPISVCADFSVPLIGTVGIEGRYSHQMSDLFKTDDTRYHTFMLYLHAFL